MDYILFGFGTGATLALGGWLFRDLGPRLRDRTPAEGEVLSAREMVSRMAWARFCSACGASLALAGIIVMLVTVGTAIWNPTDDEGFLVVLIAYAVVTVLMLIWAGVFLRLFGAAGIIRPREAKPALATPETPSKPAVTSSTVGEGQQDEESRPARSFAELASARGGLSRFAGFFRRDTPSDDEVEEPVRRIPSRPAGPMSETPRVRELPAEMTPEDIDEAEAKRLTADDPLVIDVLGEIPEERVVEPDLEASLIADLLMPGSAPESDAEEAGETENAEAEMSPEELALERLRRKRLARLSGSQDD